MIEFTLNGKMVRSDDDPSTPLLWVVRDTFKLKGSKFGCGAGLCGVCTLHIDGDASRSCTMPLSAVAGRKVTTIEGLRTPDDMHPLQEAWVELSVPQCGYCQSGQIMPAASLLKRNPNPSRTEVDDAIIFGLTAALYGDLALDKGAFKQSNFHDYPIMRMSEASEVEVIIDSGTEPTGVGEPGLPLIAPAVASAVFKATGQRLRSLPLRIS
jgi:isoquinoline 1-oxidoreductase alpha subunit